MILDGEDGGNVNDKTLIHLASNTEWSIYEAMKKFPATSAIMMKCLFKRFILSNCYRETKDRGIFSYWAKATNPNKRELLPRTPAGINFMIDLYNSVLRLANDGHLSISQALTQLRKYVAWAEIGYSGLVFEEFKAKVARIIRAVQEGIFALDYQKVYKRCHNRNCQNTCRHTCSCRETRYCSAACQNADWKRHKQTCQFIRQSAPAA
jgi:hypothetical protein